MKNAIRFILLMFPLLASAGTYHRDEEAPPPAVDESESSAGQESLRDYLDRQDRIESQKMQETTERFREDDRSKRHHHQR